MPILTIPGLWLIVLLLCTNGVAGVMWYVKSNDAASYKQQLETCQANAAAFKNQVVAEGQLAAARAKATEEQNRRTADETAKGWAAALDVVRRSADNRVRLALANRGAGGSGVSVYPVSAPGINAPAQGDLPPPERVLADCSEDVLTLAWLQDFVAKTSHPER
jgi:hypothetical protein